MEIVYGIIFIGAIAAIVWFREYIRKRAAQDRADRRAGNYR
ncbi:hypothetical protein GCM10027449_26540 [Sinomonas notoginsengisoli]|nr:hypothetical protein [Sinomonas notoginsengisoli]